MTDRNTDRDQDPDRDRGPDPDRAADSGPNSSREDLEARLGELETTLEELRGELRDERAGPPRPPSLSELLRFTEQYTIPSLIALLETTIKSLELLQGTLRLADPGRELPREDGQRRRGASGPDRLAGVRENAEAQLASTLSDLREALSAADLPEESAPRSVLQEARELTAEIEAELAESARPEERGPPPATGPTESASPDAGDGDVGDSDRGSESRHDGAVHIDVHDPTSEGESRRESSETVDGDGPVAGEPADVATETEPEDGTEPERVSVDVDSELESIKRELGDEDATEEGEEAAESDSDANADSGENVDDDEADDASPES